MERFKFDIFRADDFGRFASVQGQSGQSQFAPLKLRSLALVPSSGAQSAPTNSTYGSSTARIFPPGSATPVRYSRPFRAPAPPADMRPSSANRDGIPVPGTVPTSGQPAAAPLSPLRPPSWGGETPSSATIVCQGDTFTFKLDQALADNGGIFLIIEASEGLSNGVSRAHAKAVAIKMVEEPDATAVDIRADYVAKHGAPSAAALKIFFRYYFVNSSTGEKSGEMLTLVTLDEDALVDGE